MSSLIGDNGLGGLVGSELLGSGSVRLAGNETSAGPVPPTPPEPIPLPLGSLLFMFDPLVGVTRSGADATAIADQSGNGFDMVKLAVAPEYVADSLNGNPGLRCTGIPHQGMHNPSIKLTLDNAARTLISVVNPSNAFAQGLFDWRTSSQNFYQALGFAGAGYIYGNSLSNAIVASDVPQLAPFICFHICTEGDPNQISLIYNGTTPAVSNPETAGGDTGAGGFVSMNIDDGSLPLLGDLLWQAGLNRAPTDVEIAEISGALSRRFDIQVYAELTMSAPSLTVPPGGSQTFTGHDGAGGYVFGFAANNSGGSMDAATGVYVAGALSGVIDVVRVRDLAGFSYTLNVSVTAAIATTHLTNGLRLLTVGDSTTTVTTPAWWNPNFFNSVDGALAPGSVVHLQQGHPGALLSDVLANFDAWITAETPDVVYVTVGINDVVASNVPPSTWAAEIRQLIARILGTTTATQIVLTAITCYGEIWSPGPVWGPNVPNYDPVIDARNSITESIIIGLRNPKVTFCNFRNQLLAWEVVNNPAAGASGFATIDGVHPNAAGGLAESGFAFAQVIAP